MSRITWLYSFPLRFFFFFRRFSSSFKTKSIRRIDMIPSSLYFVKKINVIPEIRFCYPDVMKIGFIVYQCFYFHKDVHMSVFIEKKIILESLWRHNFMQNTRSFCRLREKNQCTILGDIVISHLFCFTFILRLSSFYANS